MKLLRSALYWEAGLLAVGGAVLTLFPRWLTVDVFDQIGLAENAWIRLAGIHAVGWAIVYVLVAHRIEDLWWFSWAFVIVGGAIAALALVNVLFGLPEGSDPLMWWLLFAAAVLLAAGILAGLAKAGTERSPT